MACNAVYVGACSSSFIAFAPHAARPFSSCSTPFINVSSLALAAPASSDSSRVKPLSVAYNLSEDDTMSPMRKAVVGGVVAAGAALSVFIAGSVFPSPSLAIGPGTGGYDIVRESREILKNAPKLNAEDAPRQFSPGPFAGSAEDKRRIAPRGQGSTLSQLQEGPSDVTSKLGVKGKEAEQSAADQVLSYVEGVKGEGQNVADAP